MSSRRLVIYEDGLLSISQSERPSNLGHVVAYLKRQVDLFSLAQQDFVNALEVLRIVASRLGAYHKVERCALITEGRAALSVLPLHGLSADWKPITAGLPEFNASFPGYISSRNGPPMPHEQLDEITTTIRRVSGLPDSYSTTFQGSGTDDNLFARIIRGEMQQWRVWEDDQHVAFLTPFPNTPGFTVLVPRKHLSSNIFALSPGGYAALMKAAHQVGGILKQAFKTSACGMIFEGFEIDYAHVKLIPNFDTDTGRATHERDGSEPVGAYQLKYEGYVSSLEGPQAKDTASLEQSSKAIRDMLAGDMAA